MRFAVAVACFAPEWERPLYRVKRFSIFSQIVVKPAQPVKRESFDCLIACGLCERQGFLVAINRLLRLARCLKSIGDKVERLRERARLPESASDFERAVVVIYRLLKLSESAV